MGPPPMMGDKRTASATLTTLLLDIVIFFSVLVFERGFKKQIYRGGELRVIEASMKPVPLETAE